MAVARGHQSYILVAPETTYGVAATTGFFKNEVISMSCDPVIGSIMDTSLNTVRSRRGVYQGGLLYRGTIRVRANYEGGALPLLMRAAHLGGASGAIATTGYNYTQNAVGPPAANTHLFTEGTTLRSLTIQMQEGAVAATVQEVRGAVITGYTFRIAAGQSGDAMGVFEFSFVAQSKTEGITENAGAAAFPAVNPVLFHQCITQVDGSGDATPLIRALEFSYSAPYNDSRYQLGNVNPLQPLPNDFVATTMKITREFDSTAQFVKARSFAAPAAALEFVFQGATITGVHKYEMAWKAVNARITEYGHPVEDYDVVQATTTWTPYLDATTGSMTFRTKASEAQLT
jgi:hypothetical protein